MGAQKSGGSVSLLSKALEQKTRKHIARATPEQVELAVAVLRQQVTARQAAFAMGRETNGTGVVHALWVYLRSGLENGMIKIEIVKNN